LKIVKCRKTKLEQWVYVSLNDVDDDYVFVAIESKGKVISRSRYKVLEKVIRRNGKIYTYRYINVHLPWFNVIRWKKGDPRDLVVKVYALS